MNGELPVWWLVLSAVFFTANLAMFVGLTFLAVRLAKIAQELKPKVEDLTVKANQTLVQVQDVAKKVQEVADKVSTTTNDVSSRARNVVGSAEVMAHSASKQFEKFSPFVVGAVTAMRLVRALNDIRGGRKAGEALSKTGQKKRPAKKGGILGLLRRRSSQA